MAGERFSVGMEGWEARLGLVRDVVRQELVSRQLAAHLPEPSRDIRILDVGSGQGTLAIRLAEQGYDVTGIEPSEKLLDHARSDLAESAKAPTFLRGTLEDIPAEAGSDFDVVCCHGVLMYLPELGAAVDQLVRLAKPSGIISVLTRNRASLAIRAGMKKDWAATQAGFGARYYKNNIGVEDVRADEPQEVIDALQAHGAALVSWYGVRLFTDHWPDQPPPPDIAQIIEVEYQAGASDPYRQLASLTHVIARKDD